MAQGSETKVFPVNINKFFSAIIDYEKYPEFIPGVNETKVLSQDESGARVEYAVNVIKKFSYIVKLKHEEPTKVSWTLESGDLFKSMDGSWELKSLSENETEVTYTVGIDFKMFAPKMIVNTLVKKNLPEVMEEMFKQAQKR